MIKACQREISLIWFFNPDHGNKDLRIGSYRHPHNICYNANEYCWCFDGHNNGDRGH